MRCSGRLVPRGLQASSTGFVLARAGADDGSSSVLASILRDGNLKFPGMG
jgi:hypothetical protein